jgi:hypothetical protein
MIEEELKKFYKLSGVPHLFESGYPRVANAIRGIVPSINTVGIFTGQNPQSQKATNTFNKEINKNVEKTLRDGNFGIIKLDGNYGVEEESFLVPNIAKDELIRLGNKLDQTSVIFGEKTNNGMHFQEIWTTDGVNDEDIKHKVGDINKEQNVFINDNNFVEYYSEIKGRRFRIPFYDDDYNGAYWKNGEIIKPEKITKEWKELIDKVSKNSINENRTNRYKIRHELFQILKRIL